RKLTSRRSQATAAETSTSAADLNYELRKRDTRAVPALRAERALAKVNLTLRILGRRADGYHDLESLVVFARLADRLTLRVNGELAYYAEQAETANALYVLVLTLAIVMGAGATFGALNTMYAAVANRTPEIGTLRALGFGRGAILVSFLAESLMLA